MPPTSWPEKLNPKLATGQLGLIFVGMSNVGKSYQTKKLASHYDGHRPFKRVCVDDLIEQALSEQLKADGIDSEGIEAVAEWMGSPHADDVATRRRYDEREQTYLAVENSIYKNLLEMDYEQPWTVDTTGSFVHCRPDIQQSLARRGIVVYIEATKADMDTMLTTYITHPKPVCWAGHFQRGPSESMSSAIESSYRRLLRVRDAGYRELADVTIAKRAVQATTSPIELLQLIDDQLR